MSYKADVIGTPTDKSIKNHNIFISYGNSGYGVSYGPNKNIDLDYFYNLYKDRFKPKTPQEE